MLNIAEKKNAMPYYLAMAVSMNGGEPVSKAVEKSLREAHEGMCRIEHGGLVGRQIVATIILMHKKLDELTVRLAKLESRMIEDPPMPDLPPGELDNGLPAGSPAQARPEVDVALSDSAPIAPGAEAEPK